MRSVSRRPPRSNRHNSTLVALAENNAKFVPRPSHVEPSGCGEPAEMWPLRGLRNEKDGSKGWDNNMKLRAITRHNGRYLSGVPHIASPVDGRIGIENFPPSTGKGHAHAIVAQHLRCEIHHHDTTFVSFARLAEPGEGAVVGVVGDEPFEAAGVAIKRVQRRQVAIEPVEVADQTLNAGMG